MASRAAGRRSEPPVEELVEGLSIEELREALVAAAERHEDVDRHVRLVGARAAGDLAQLRVGVDRGLRTRRFLDYRESMAWARAAGPILAELEVVVEASPSRALVELLQRAIGHVVKVIMHADDSSGSIGDLARELLVLHPRACDAGVADPVALASWVFRFRFVEQDFFEADPVRYAAALGEAGIAAYRELVDAHPDRNSFAARYARERLAVLRGDAEEIVELLGGDLNAPYHFIRVAQAMTELGRDDEVLKWTGRGIAETDGWQVAQLYDLACAVHERRGNRLEVLSLRRGQHERMASLTTYNALRKAAEPLDGWPRERPAARAALQRRDVRALVEALLGDGEVALAWETSATAALEQIGDHLWLRLAEARTADAPADALAVYQRVVAGVLAKADRRAYSAAVRMLKSARTTAQAAGMQEDFQEYLATLREQHRRRPTLIAMLDKAQLR